MPQQLCAEGLRCPQQLWFILSIYLLIIFPSFSCVDCESDTEMCKFHDEEEHTVGLFC